MAISPHLMYLTILVLASHVMLGDAAVRVRGFRASGLSADALGNRADAYVKVWCAGVYGGRTETIKGTNNPNWAAEFNFPSCNSGSTLKMEVWDQDLIYDDYLGGCSYRLPTSVSSCSLKKGTLYFTATVR